MWQTIFYCGSNFSVNNEKSPPVQLNIAPRSYVGESVHYCTQYWPRQYAGAEWSASRSGCFTLSKILWWLL